MVTVNNSFHDIDTWLAMQKSNFTNDELEQFRIAIQLAEKYYANLNLYPTQMLLLPHALNCANTIAGLNLYSDAVIATILYALPRNYPQWQQLVRTHFNDKIVEVNKIIELIDGVTEVTKIRKVIKIFDENTGDLEKDQLEVIRKMLLAMVSDIRVVIILLVGRGELMLHLKSCDDVNMQTKIAKETVEIFAPLANRLGVWQIKWELEDLSFKYLHAEQYKKIANLLDETREERLNYINSIKEFLSKQMEASSIVKYQVTGRAKHIYSIWKKMKKKSYDFDDLYDIRAIRVLVPEIKDCYTVLGIIHTEYIPISGEFDDYISNPKKK